MMADRVDDDKLYRMPARLRYEKDTDFHRLVDLLHHTIERAQFSPSELREAAVLAAVKYEERRAHMYRVDSFGHVDRIE